MYYIFFWMKEEIIRHLLVHLFDATFSNDLASKKETRRRSRKGTMSKKEARTTRRRRTTRTTVKRAREEESDEEGLLWRLVKGDFPGIF